MLKPTKKLTTSARKQDPIWEQNGTSSSEQKQSSSRYRAHSNYQTGESITTPQSSTIQNEDDDYDQDNEEDFQQVDGEAAGDNDSQGSAERNQLLGQGGQQDHRDELSSDERNGPPHHQLSMNGTDNGSQLALSENKQ